MKLTAWLLPALAPLTALSILAQTSNTLPPVVAPPPAPAAAAPATPEAEPAAQSAKPAKAAKKKAKHAKAPSTKSSIVLNPPVTATVKCNVLDVRGQGSFSGEIITYLKKGESVTVLEEITLNHVRSNEPAQWSKIVMPANTAVWVDGEYIDPETKAVRATKVNVRGGPGENYSIIARLDKGTAVTEIGKKDAWLEIAAPTNAYAFVASQYLEQGAPVAEAAAPPPPAEPPAAAPAPAPAPPVVVNVPAETPPPAPAQAPGTGLTAPAPTAASQSDQEHAAAHPPAAPEPAPTPAPEAVKEGPRIVTREGFVHHALNIQAPAGYELHDIKTGVLTEYLQPTPGQKSFKIFIGTRVRVTGTEFFDPDWPRTPILHIETVDLMP